MRPEDLTREELEQACYSLRKTRDAVLKRNEDQRAEIARLLAENARLRERCRALRAGEHVQGEPK